jgi:hypothetical protein
MDHEVLLQPDDKGNIFTYPVIHWATGHGTGSFVLLAIEYLRRADGMEGGQRQTIPLILLPAQARDLADLLTEAVQGQFPDPPLVPQSASLR